MTFKWGLIRFLALLLIVFFLTSGTGMATEQTYYFLGDDHAAYPLNYPDESVLILQQDEVASLEADSTYGWAFIQPEETENTYSGPWSGQVKFSSPLPPGYIIGYAVLTWDPATNETVQGPSSFLMGNGTQTVFDIALSGNITVPAGHHLAFGFNNLILVTGHGYASFDIITGENNGAGFPSTFVAPASPSRTFCLLGDDHQPNPVAMPYQSAMVLQQDEGASLEAESTYGWAFIQPQETEKTYTGSWTGQIKFHTPPPDNYIIGYALLSWDPVIRDFVHGPVNLITGDGSTKIFALNLHGSFTVPAGHHLALGFNNATPGSGYEAFNIIVAENDGTVRPSFLTGPTGDLAEEPEEGHTIPYYFLGDDHAPNSMNYPDESAMILQQDEVASLEAYSTYGWAFIQPEEIEQTYIGPWSGQVKFSSPLPPGYIIGYAVLTWDPATNETVQGPSGFLMGNGTQTVFDIALSGDITVSPGHHLAFGFNNLIAVTGYGDESFDIITVEKDGTGFPSSFIASASPSRTFCLMGDDHEPNPVDWPNQSAMVLKQDEVASLEAQSTYGWAFIQPQETERVYSGAWSGQIKFDPAPPDNYVFAYAVLSWNPDTREFVHGPIGLITGDGSTKVFNLSLHGDIKVPAGHHLALGINNIMPESGYETFNIITAENAGTVRPSFLNVPYQPSGKHPKMVQWGSYLVADFGENGLRAYKDGSWQLLAQDGNVNQMTVWDGYLVVDFGQERGLKYNDGNIWHLMTSWDNVKNMMDWNGRLVVDFGGERGMRYFESGNWTWMTGWDVSQMIVWGDNLLADFGTGRGLYLHNGAGWQWLTNWADVNHMAAWGNRLVVDFGKDRGLRYYEDGTWHWMTNWADVNHMVAWGGDLAVDFGQGRGFYLHNQTNWQWLTNWAGANGMLAWGNDLAVDFGTNRGFYLRNNTGWQWLTNWSDAVEMVIWDDGFSENLAADFGAGKGLYYHDRAAWNWMTSWSTAE